MGERLQKILAHAGVESRRAAERLIQQGRVSIDGVVVTELGVKADPTRQRIFVDGVLIHLPDELVYIALNKPRGYVTTRVDPHHPKRRTIISLLPHQIQSVHHVGRLDKESEGLLLLTNDGEFTNLLTHPSHGIQKTYVVAVAGKPVNEKELLSLIEGVEVSSQRISGGRKRERLRADAARVIQCKEDEMVLEIVLHEGRKRQIRRMLEVDGRVIRQLVRTAIGPLKLGALSPGRFRHLQSDEVDGLKEAAQMLT